ncbi:MAG: hypothetical protein QMD85_02805 [Candidatus Aenigmarchaeota archaeon]|nr:hypothetical protein [Candidatus Aenigmarchaeota archaeon]MDI6722479.1 hypothetical protein [Candidatus Aenigmarchaeota archaeon]
MAVLREKIVQRSCLMCEGSIEKSNAGNICNECKDKMIKQARVSSKLV